MPRAHHAFPLTWFTESPAESEDVSEIYHERSKLYPPVFGESRGARELSSEEVRRAAHAFKQYPSLPRLRLPAMGALPPLDATLEGALRSRRTTRTFADAPLRLHDLARLLLLSYGITGAHSLPGGGEQHLRAAPSAGALYPAEIYVFARQVEGVEPGLHHYDVLHNELERLLPSDLSARVHAACCMDGAAREAAATLFLSGVFARTRSKYRERGYRYVLLDVGHLAQNLCLVATASNLAVKTSCTFFDTEVDALLGLDGVDEATLYVVFVGKAEPSLG